MKLYLTTIGENTTDIAKWQAERLGFEVTLLDKKEPWIEKYKRFISLADDNCIRCDADISLNENILECHQGLEDMIQYSNYCLYKNNLSCGNPVYYSKKALDLLRDNLEKLREDRPETSAWRFIESKGLLVYTDEMIVGIHGFYQNIDAIYRAEENKRNRNQIMNYDFALARKIHDEIK